MADKTKTIKAGAEDNGEEIVKPTTVQVPKEKTIEVSEATLRKLIASNEKLTQQVDALNSNAVSTQANNGMVVRRKVKESDIRLRKWDNKYVIGLENIGTEKRPIYIYDIMDKETRRAVQYVNLILEDGSKVEKVDYIYFLRDAENVPNCRVVEKVEHEEVKEYGMIPKKDMAENGYGMFETMVLVPVEVTTKTYTFKIKVADRDELLEVNSQWANL